MPPEYFSVSDDYEIIKKLHDCNSDDNSEKIRLKRLGQQLIIRYL